jgi:hypothetical protein
MSWLKIDDKFVRHPKLIKLGSRSDRWTWLELLSYAAEFKSPVVPENIRDAVPAATTAFLAKAVAAGLLDVVEDGYEIHDWHDYQPRDATNAERQARHRSKLAEAASNGARNGESNGSDRYENGSRAQERARVPVPSHREITPDGVISLLDDASQAPSGRPRDHVWEAAEQVFGTVTNPKERGKRNDAVKALRDSLAHTPTDLYVEEMLRRKQILEGSWGKPCTAHALASNWAEAERIAAFLPPPDPTRRQPRALVLADDVRDTAQRVLDRIGSQGTMIGEAS